MALITGSVPSFINGVSQQPESLRLLSQGSEQINASSSVVDGLKNRTGSTFIGDLGEIPGEIFTHIIQRDELEGYVVVAQSDSIKVFGKDDGLPRPINGAGFEATGFPYTVSSSPKLDFRCVTVADFTFFLNRSVEVKAKPAPKTLGFPSEALIWIRQGVYGATYKIILDGIESTYTTPDGSSAAHASLSTTTYIAEQLETALNTNHSSFYTFTRLGSTIHVSKPGVEIEGTGGSPSYTPTPLILQTEDALGDTALKSVIKKVQSFVDLPPRAPEGYLVEITGDTGADLDNYYVEFASDGTGSYSGVWKETYRRYEDTEMLTDVLISLEERELLETTLPHVLISNADGSFEFKTFDWSARTVGDLETDPMPSFVGRTINDVFFHRNRLGFLADENVILSRAGDYGDFFRDTVTTILDDDPIDVAVSHTKVSILNHAVPFNKSLVLFSAQSQFELGSADVLTPNTIRIDLTTDYDCSTSVKPVGAGNNVYFPYSKGGFTAIREYFTDGVTDTDEAYDITAHVPRFIEGEAKKIVSSSRESFLAILTDKTDRIYVYQYHWEGGQKIQSCWGVWTFGSGEILDMSCEGSEILLVIKRGDLVSLEALPLDTRQADPDLSFNAFLDRKVFFASASPSVNLLDTPDGSLLTEISLPYPVSSLDSPIVMTSGFTPGFGQLLQIDEESSTATTLVISGDWTGRPLIVGDSCLFTFRLSQLNLRYPAKDGGENVVRSGRLQLRRLEISLGLTGHIEAVVTTKGRESKRYIKSTSRAGAILGTPVIAEGDFSFPIAAQNEQTEITLFNPTPFPTAVLTAEWEGFYTARARRS